MRRPPICSRPSMRLCAWSTSSPGRSPRSSPWIGRGAEEQRVDGEAGEDLGAADRACHGQRFVRPKQADVLAAVRALDRDVHLLLLRSVAGTAPGDGRELEARVTNHERKSIMSNR